MKLTPTPEFTAMLDDAKKRAAAVNPELDGVVLLQLGGEFFKCHATGAKGGFKFRLEGEDYLIMIGSALREWTISVRYLSSGLWAYGWHVLRDRAFHALAAYTVRDTLDCVRVSRADYCFDFWSPAFSAEFNPGLARYVVAHAGVKHQERGSYAQWGVGAKGETLTIGSKASLQNQLYDKTKEITEQSGKTWLYAVWRKNIGFDPWPDDKARHVWRLECRHASDYLKERNICRPFEVLARLPELIAEACFKRRVAYPRDATDTNRWRWPLHPLFSEAYRQFSATEMVPLGRLVTGARSALVDAASKQLAGAVRSAVILEHGAWDDGCAREIVDKALKRIDGDSKHEKKVNAAMDRYSTVEVGK